MPANLVLRTANATDAEGVSVLLTTSYAQLFSQSYSPDVLEAALPIMTRANSELLASGLYHVVQTGDGTTVGCGGWSLADPATRTITPGIAHIRHFATHPGWLGRGIGRMVYARCETQALSQDVANFMCWSSLNGEPFYAALGFTSIRTVVALLANHTPFPAIEMTRSIGPRIHGRAWPPTSAS